MTQPAGRRFLAQPSEAEQVVAKPASRPSAVFSALGTGLMASLLVLLVGIGVAVSVVPAVTGSVTLTVLSSSMEPALPAGTLIVVRPTEPADIVPGRVLTYQLKSGEPTLVTHRVTQRMLLADGSPVFITKGDANAQPDLEPVKPVQIRGTVWYAIPYLGRVANLLTGDLRAIVVSVVVGALLLYAAWMFIAAARDRVAGEGAGESGAPVRRRAGGRAPRRGA